MEGGSVGRGAGVASNSSLYGGGVDGGDGVVRGSGEGSDVHFCEFLRVGVGGEGAHFAGIGGVRLSLRQSAGTVI
jgi:hypothetical protein